MPSTVLVAEDDTLIMALLRASFRRTEFGLLEAPTGMEALALARVRHPVVALLDVGLPDIDGYTVCRHLRAQPDGAGIHVIILTARTSSADRRRAEQAGADAFMTKPFSPTALLAAVREACAPA